LACIPWHSLTRFCEAVLLESWQAQFGVDNHFSPDLPASVADPTGDLGSSEWTE